jgi:hypothetical protein
MPANAKMPTRQAAGFIDVAREVRPAAPGNNSSRGLHAARRAIRR